MAKKGKAKIPLLAVVDALTLYEGCIPLAAQHLGVETTYLRSRIAGNPRLQELLASKRMEIVDIAELSLRRKAMDGEGWAVTFALRTLGVAAGLPYNDKLQLEHSGPNGGPIETNSQITVQHVLSAMLGSDEHLERARQQALTVEPEKPAIPSEGNGRQDLSDSNPGLFGGNGKRRPVEAGPTPAGDRPGSDPLHPGEPGGNGKGPHTPD